MSSRGLKGTLATIAVASVLLLVLSAGASASASRTTIPGGAPQLRHTANAERSVEVASTVPYGHSARAAVASPAVMASLSAGSPPAAAGPTAPHFPPGITVGTHFTGLSFSNSSCSCAPPDVQVAVGPSHVVEMVNLGEKIWTKAGHVVSSSSLHTFFGISASDFISDPKVLYDNQSARWFASILDVTLSEIFVGASSSSNPTLLWHFYILPSLLSGSFPDQPILGVSKNLVVLAGNDYNGSTSMFTGGILLALNKSSMLTGALTYYNFWGPKMSWFSMHPVHSVSPTATEFVVMTSGSASLKVYKLTGTPSVSTHASLSAATTLTLSSFSTPPSAPQKGTTAKVDTGDTRIQDAAYKTGVLWLTFNTGCTPAGDSSTRSCVRLVQLATGSTTTVAQDFNIAKKKTYLFYGALALDGSLNVGVVYGYSNGSVYPVLAVTGHLASALPGTLLASVILVKGTAAFSASFACSGGVCRWGDYYGAGADPTSPNLWVAGQFCLPSTYWSTWVSQIRV